MSQKKLEFAGLLPTLKSFRAWRIERQARKICYLPPHAKAYMESTGHPSHLQASKQTGITGRRNPAI